MQAHPRFLPALSTIVAGLSLPLIAADLHVAPTGRIGNPGTAAAPLPSLAAAREAARKFAGKEPVTIHLADGVYYLPETLVFSPADSGTATAPVIYQADHEGKAILSGGQRLPLDWRPHANGIFKATTPDGLAIDQLFVNGIRQRMARYPNYDAAQTTAAYQGFAADAFSKERAAKWANPAGGFIHAMHRSRWGGYHYRITGKNPDGSVAYEGGWQNNRQMGMHNEFRMVENIFEELDAPGEWFHQADSHTLYFQPEPGLDLTTATIEVVRLRHLVEFKGSATSPVRWITLRGIVFRHAARTFMDTKEPLLRSDWTIYRGGAVVLTGTEHVSLLDSEFDQLGGNAIFVNQYNRQALIKGCHIHDTGASGVCFVGDPAAVRNPLFEYAQTQDLTKIERTPGPQTNNYPADSAVEDCLIHGIGRVERQPAAIQLSMAYRIAVRDTSIYDCARAGINISEGTWGGHLIERCDVFDTVLETHDHGSFNSWGRDRYWSGNHRGVSQPEVIKDPKLPYLDAMTPTIIRNSRWRCDHGWDIDLDDGSSNYQLYNNLLLAGGLKFREGYGRDAYNNVIINNGFHPHVWFDDSASGFHSNIVMKAHADIGQPRGWGRLVDRNLFTSEADRTRNLDAGADANSLAGDPQFIDPAAGDFRVKESSPALKPPIGFKNFAMDQFGVKKPALKAIAKTPVIPAVESASPVAPAPLANQPHYWLGASLHGLQGEEFSAFGVSKESGGVQLVTVPAGSAAAQAGLLTNDLIQQLNQQPVTGIQPLFSALGTLGDSPLKITLIRNQQPLIINLTDAPFVAIETAREPSGWVRLVPPTTPGGGLSATPRPNNDPLATLTDGKLARSYGPVFSNQTRSGAYKMDLGATAAVTAISSWSFDQDGRRGHQRVTLYGSNFPTDPGWNTADSTRFSPLASLHADLPAGVGFLAASLRARPGHALGSFRWIVWTTQPLNPTGENTAFQELAVETAAKP